VLDESKPWRDSGSALLEAFDEIDLADIQTASAVEAATRKVGRVAAIADRIRAELDRCLSPRLFRAAAE
jgi:hypothetical protein